MCATSLTYFFLDNLIKKHKINFNLSNFLIYVLLATVCDVMPLRKLNRIIALNVINDFNIKNNLAINILYELCKVDKIININNLGFLIGPIINSGGRLGKSNYAVELLSSDDIDLVRSRCIQLIKLNEKRKKIETIALNEIDLKKIENNKKKVIVYYKSNINEGIIGILAARLKDHFNKPSIVITNSNNILKGSCRSTKNFNIGNVIKMLRDKKIIISGGGHNFAAGFTIKKSKVTTLENFILNYYNKSLSKDDLSSFYDCELSTTAFNMKFYTEIQKLSPYGNGNRMPIFIFKGLKIIKSSILNNKHISAIVRHKNGKSINTICFNSAKSNVGNYLLSYKKEINLIGQIYLNNWNGKKTLQLNVKDIVI